MMYGYIDKPAAGHRGRVQFAAPFSEGLAAVSNAMILLYRQTGREVISGGFTYASSFSGGLARWSANQRRLLSGYVDKRKSGGDRM